MSETATIHGLRIRADGLSEQGPRSENQDAILLESLSGLGLVAVADGMGGERGGRIAADTSLRALESAAPIRSLEEARRAVRDADAAIRHAAEERPDTLGGMGCALALLSLVRARDGRTGWITAHVGDVRVVSRSPDGTVRLETRDHTPAFARWEAGEIELDEVPEAEGSNRLQRAVGRGGEADATLIPARPGWSYLLLSDGVTKAMRLDEIGEAMAAGDPADVCARIREKVLERGPDDNFSAVIVRIDGGPAPATTPHEETTMIEPAPASTARYRAALFIAVLALIASLGAAWLAWTARPDPVEQVRLEREVTQLRQEVEALRAEVGAIADPFGPDATVDETPP